MKQVSASSYCSRNRRDTIASRKCRVPRFSVYQLGRGSEPVIVVGRMMSLVARYMRTPSLQFLLCGQDRRESARIEQDAATDGRLPKRTLVGLRRITLFCRMADITTESGILAARAARAPEDARWRVIARNAFPFIVV